MMHLYKKLDPGLLPGTSECAAELPSAILGYNLQLERGFVVSRRKIAVLPPGMGHVRRAGGKVGLAAAAASLGLCFLGGAPAAASHYRHHRAHAPSSYFGSESPGLHQSHRRGGRGERAESGKPEPAKHPSGPLILAISINKQRVTVYDNGTPVAVSPISTGVTGHPTPMGVFSVIQKQRWHRSNLYSDAPMPFMQRITWSGIALHAGVVPGHPASHGCIRLPERFAVRLWGLTKVGARVVIARGDSAPYEINHPRLAGLVKTPEAAHEPSATSGRSPAAQYDGSETGASPVVVATTDAVTAGVAGTEKSPDGSGYSASKTGASAAPQVDGAPSLEKPAETRRTAEPSAVEPAPPPQIADPLQRPGPLSLFVSRKEGKLFVRKGFTPVFDTPIAIAHPEVPLGTHVFTASRPASEGFGVRWFAVSIGNDRAAAARVPAKRKAAHAARDERPMPLTAESLHQAAVQALDRIELPPEALERIAPLVVPGASLLISDQGLGAETGRDTDFIVVTK
jgi:L,D-transpeptidase catalytic domain